MLQTIADPADCGKLYLCEISATSSQLLTQYEAETVQMFKRTYKAKVRAKRDKNITQNNVTLKFTQSIFLIDNATC